MRALGAFRIQNTEIFDSHVAAVGPKIQKVDDQGAGAHHPRGASSQHIKPAFFGVIGKKYSLAIVWSIRRDPKGKLHDMGRPDMLEARRTGFLRMAAAAVSSRIADLGLDASNTRKQRASGQSRYANKSPSQRGA